MLTGLIETALRSFDKGPQGPDTTSRSCIGCSRPILRRLCQDIGAPKMTAVPHLLFIDDEATLQGLMAERLSERGFEVVEADSGERALELSTSSPLTSSSPTCGCQVSMGPA